MGADYLPAYALRATAGKPRVQEAVDGIGRSGL